MCGRAISEQVVVMMMRGASIYKGYYIHGNSLPPSLPATEEVEKLDLTATESTAKWGGTPHARILPEQAST